jgi:hypothetical protein
MKVLTALVGMMVFCSLVAHSQQPQQQPLTPEEKQRAQEQADAVTRAKDSIDNLMDLTNKIVKQMVRQCVATGVIESRCECLANSIPMGISEDKEIWGDVRNRTPWIAYVSLVTLDIPEVDILSKLKTADAKKIIQTAFQARYKCT